MNTLPIQKNVPIPAPVKRGAASKKYAPTIRVMTKGDAVELPVWDAQGFRQLCYKMGRVAVLRRWSESTAMVWIER